MRCRLLVLMCSVAGRIAGLARAGRGTEPRPCPSPAHCAFAVDPARAASSHGDAPCQAPARRPTTATSDPRKPSNVSVRSDGSLRRLARVPLPRGAAALWPSASPSAYEDMLGYALWPREYATNFWSHGPHDIMQAMMAPMAANSVPASGVAPAWSARHRRASGRAKPSSRTPLASMARKERALQPVDRIPERSS